ncbi:FAD-dependent oxidoreductase [Microbacterium elymi]|uniref:FAD-dependent oxidoreductase n=1 Tax=Microbacterium elymi TaxID=2909587 RepID=UPI00338EF72A
MTILGRFPQPTALNAARRRRELAVLGDRPQVDVLVIGGGITGAGIALDAASRGLRTVLVEAHDLAYGTSRFSSKLVHGGLRYLATGQFGIAYESAAERHLLMTRIAPHLTRPLAQLTPLHGSGYIARGAYIGLGYGLGDGLRRVAGTPGRVLHAPALIGPAELVRRAPAVRQEGCTAGCSAGTGSCSTTPAWWWPSHAPRPGTGHPSSPARARSG